MVKLTIFYFTVCFVVVCGGTYPRRISVNNYANKNMIDTSLENANEKIDCVILN